MTDPLDRLASLLDDLPGRFADAQRRAAELAGRMFVAEAADGSVAATVDGAGQLVAISMSATLARRMDNLTFGDRIVEAVNKALDDADAARAELLAAGVPTDDLAGAEELFAYRMNELQRILDSVESRLRGLAD